MKFQTARSVLLALVLVGTIGAAAIGTAESAVQENLDTYRDCPMEGSARSLCTQDQNRLKNRWHAPSDSDINPGVTLDAVLQQGDDSDRWSSDAAAEITGYVASVEVTGAESCNCGSDNDGETDFHSNVVTGPSVHSECSRMVVEFTPRCQHLNNWTFDQVSQEIEHKWVKFRGWMFNDIYHMREALNTRRSNAFKCGGRNGPYTCTGPQNKKLWRRTIWEISFRQMSASSRDRIAEIVFEEDPHKRPAI